MPDAPMQSGDSFRVRTERPEWTIETLQQSGGDYPARIERRYTELPDDVPPRVTRRTSNITANASTPLETAVAIERWLQSNKRYSLNIDRPESSYVDTFMFEMDRGYCQYFASSMVVMLRSQGIPARYVTGYAPGTPESVTGGSQYTVRGEDAHAWVEVYFEGVGWVTFDPTPPRRATVRADTQQASFSTGPSNSNTARIGSLRLGPAPAATQTTDEWEEVNASVEFTEDPEPGENLTVIIRRNGQRVSDYQVRFNGDAVGITNQRGRATGTVPYADELVVTVYQRASEEASPTPTPTPPTSTETPTATPTPEGQDSDSSTPQGTPGSDTPAEGSESDVPKSDGIRSLRKDGRESPLAGSLTKGDLSQRVLFTIVVSQDDAASRERLTDTRRSVGERTNPRLAALTSTPPTLTSREAAPVARPEGGVAVPLATNITLSVDAGEPVPGQNITLRATLSGEPVPNATVRLVNETYRTDTNGTVVVRVPYRDTFAVRAARGDANGSRSIVTVGTLQVDGAERPVAGSEVTLSVTIQGQPVPEAQVSNEVFSVRTAPNGTATIGAPFSNTTTLSVRRGTLQSNRTIALRTTPTSIDIPQGVSVGDTVPIRATVAGEPLHRSTVTINGAVVGRTAPNGSRDVAIPYRESVDIAVSRGSVRATRTVELENELKASIRGTVVPGLTVTVSATAAGDPVPNATVIAQNQTVGTTGPNGTVAVSVPLNPFATRFQPTVRRGAFRASAAGAPLWPFWVGGLVVIGIGVAALAWRYDLRAAAATLSGYTRQFVVALAAGCIRVAKRLEEALAQLASLALGLRTNTLETVRRLVTRARHLPAELLNIGQWLYTRAAMMAAVGGRSETQDGTAQNKPISATERDGESLGSRDIITAWTELVSETADPHGYAKTPSDIAEEAIDRGYPPEAVRSIRNAVLYWRYTDREIPESIRAEAQQATMAIIDRKQGEEQ